MQRYRVKSGVGKGQFISDEAVQSLTLGYIDQARDRVDALTDQLLSKEISIAAYERGLASSLKEGWINAWAIGIGGHKNFTQSDYGSIGARLRTEYQYLRGFTDAVIRGTQTEAQIRDRAKKYTDGFYTAYAQAQDEGHKRNGFAWQKDTLEPGADHCRQCVAIANMGWVRVGTTARIGGRICRHRDRCTREWSKSRARPNQQTILDYPNGWIGLPQVNNRSVF